jgi:hypothetical protein
MNLIELLAITWLDAIAFALCAAIGVINVCRMNALSHESSFAAQTGQVATMVGATVFGLQPLVFWPFGGSHASPGGLVLASACLLTLVIGRARWRGGAPEGTRRSGGAVVARRA